MSTSHCFGKTKLDHLEEQSKNHAILPQAPETSLQEYKNNHFDKYTQKNSYFYSYKYEKNIFCNIIGE